MHPHSLHRPPKFCRQCGIPLELKWIEDRERSCCPTCGLIHYMNPIPSVAAVLFQEGRFLLVRRAVEPARGEWSLPGGFIELGESVEQALIREVQEETGLLCAPIRVLDIASIVGGYYGDVIIIGYLADILSGTPRPSYDADEVEFFATDDLPPLAFDAHRVFVDRFLTEQLIRS